MARAQLSATATDDCQSAPADARIAGYARHGLGQPFDREVNYYQSIRSPLSKQIIISFV